MKLDTNALVRSRWLAFGGLLLLAVAQQACLSHSLARDGAKDQFAQKYTCPDSHLAVRSVNLSAPDFFDRGTPPADVAADRERLAMWNASVDQQLEIFDGLTAVDVTGCGAHVDYLCWLEQHPSDNTLNQVCPDIDLSGPPPPKLTFLGFAPRAEAWSVLPGQLAAHP